MGDSSKRRIGIWLKALFLTAGYLGIIYFSYRVLALWVRLIPLAWILSFLVVHIVLIAAILFSLLFLKTRQGIRTRRAGRMQPLIREQLASHAVGLDRIPELTRMRKEYPAETESCLMEFIPAVSEDTRDRLSHLAVTLGLVSSWRRQYRSRKSKKRREAIARLSQLSGGVVSATLLSSLADGDESVRLEACRGLARSGGKRELEKVFSFTLSQPLLVRAILAQDFRRHALALCEGAIPEALGSSDTERVMAALQILESWKKILPLPNFSKLLRVADPALRAAALRTLPYISGVAEVEREVIDALSETDSRVRTAAAFAAGRFAFASAVPVLAGCLRAGDEVVILSAAHALAQINPTGPEVLQNEILFSRGLSAAASLEALEKSQFPQFGLAPYR